MKTALALALLLATAAQAAEPPEFRRVVHMQKCTDDTGQVIFTNAPVKGKTCTALKTEDREPKVGDRTAQGLVIEVKPPIVKLQTAKGERWVRIDSLP